MLIIIPIIIVQQYCCYKTNKMMNYGEYFKEHNNCIPTKKNIRIKILRILGTYFNLKKKYIKSF